MDYFWLKFSYFMCGIAGIVKNHLSEADHLDLERMTNSLIHRGPDRGDSWQNDRNNLVLGHRRLSVIDLSDKGAQPMHYLDRYTIIHNGEIYNYPELKEELKKHGFQFKSNSDTEVILALYAYKKEECLQDLDGMFAFAIYDKQENTLFLARDRFGEKPFYYSFSEGKSLYFASEMKALWAAGVSRLLSKKMLYSYLVFGYVDNPEDKSATFFENIVKLPAAHFALLDCNTLKLTLKRYWDINWKEPPLKMSLQKAEEGLHELLYQSVQKRMRSDVPIGSCLSGGLDSSVIVSIIFNLNKEKGLHQKTFSARFPGFEKDESLYQDLINQQVNADSYYIVPGPNDLLSELEKVFYHQEEPFASSSIFAQYGVYKLAKEQNVTVLLDGQGADEVFGGYQHHFKPFFKELYKKKRSAFKEQHQEYTKHSKVPLPIDLRFKMEAQFSGIMEKVSLPVKQWQNRETLGDLDPGFREVNNKGIPHYYYNPASLNEGLYMNTMGSGLENLLRYADRNSMAHSREARLPFLNHKLVEFLFSLPSEFKIHNGWSKYVLRKTFEPILPPAITWRRDKTGFEPPQKQWMQDKCVKSVIQHYKEELVKQQVLDKTVLEKQPGAAAADVKGDNSWRYWMAGMLMNGTGI